MASSDYWAARGEIWKAVLYRVKIASVRNKIALAIVVAGIICVMLAKTVVMPTSRIAKSEYFLWRANSLAAQGQSEAASRAYHQALRYGGSGNVRLLNALATFLTATRSPELFTVLDRLAALEPKNFAVRYRQANLALAMGRPLVADRILRLIPEARRGDIGYLEAAASLAFERHAYDEAARLIRRAAAGGKVSPTLEFRLTEAEARGTDVARRPVARDSLTNLAREGNPDALRVMIDLELRENRPEVATDFAASLAHLPAASVTDQLLYLRLAQQTRPAEVSKITRKLQEHAERRPEEIGAVTQGLLDQGQLGVATTWLNALPPTAAASDEARRSRLLVQALGGQWADVFASLEKGVPGCPMPQKMAETARLAFAQYGRGDAEAERTWLQAIYMPEPDATTLKVLNLLASCRGWGRAQAMCLRRWTESYPRDIGAWVARAKYESAEGNLGGVCAALEAMRRIDPDDVTTNSRWVFVSCLLRRSQAEGRLETAEACYRAADPADPEVAIPYALALLAEKNNRPAAVVIEALSPADRRSPRWAMFCGAVFAANQRMAEALSYLEPGGEDLPAFPEETVFRQKWDDIARGGQDLDSEISNMLGREYAGSVERVKRELLQEMAERRRASGALNARFQREIVESRVHGNQADAAKILASLREDVQRRSKTQRELRALLESLRGPASRDG